MEFVSEAQAIKTLRQHFSDDVARQVIGVTPQFHLHTKTEIAGHEVFEREWECVSWLTKHRSLNSFWMAIDDMADLFSPTCENLLIINPTTGFTESDIDELHRRLTALTIKESKE